MIRNSIAVPLAVATCLAAVNTGLDSARLERIPARMKWFTEHAQAAGMVTLVARHGQVAQVTAEGWQDIESKVPMKADSIFQVMSMTKPVTGVGILMLAEDGMLALTDPVETYLPEFQSQRMLVASELKRPSRPITIRDLMTHTSGMSGNVPDSAGGLYQRMHLSLAEAVLLFSQQPLEFEPGTRWQYSNMGIATLGRIIEVVSGQPYERFIAARIFEPLGMKDSFFFPPPEKTNRIALVYAGENGKLVRANATILGGESAQFRKGARYPAPEFGLYSTAADLAAFYQMMLNGGRYNNRRLISRAAVDVMTEVHTGGISKAGWWPGGTFGLTFETIQDPAGTLTLMSPGTYFHGGAFGTHGWVDPKKDLVGVYLVQRTNLGDSPRNAFMNMVNAAVE